MDGRTDVRTDGHFPPLILLGRLLEVDLKSEELRELLGLEAFSLMIKKSSLRWFGMLNEKMMMTGSNVV